MYNNTCEYVYTLIKYEKDRTNLFQNIGVTFPNVQNLADMNKFVWLMSQEDPDCIKDTANFAYKAYLIRSHLLTTLDSQN